MVIDNTKQSSDRQADALTSYVDKTVSQVVVTQITADESARICADNIADIKAVANSITNILTQTKAFNENYTKLQNTMPNSNKKAIEVLDESIVKFNTALVLNINKVCEISTQINDLAKIKDTLTNLMTLERVMINLNDNLTTLVKLGANVDNIQTVAGLSANIEVIVQMQDKLIKLYDNINQLETIYFYLPDLLQVYSWIVQYKKSQQKNNFTDDEFFTSVIKLIANLESLINLSVNVKDLLAVKKQLDNAPTLLQNIKDELANLEVQYAANLRDDFINYKRELGVFVADTKIQIGELIGLLKASIGGSNTGGGGTGGATVAETLVAIKQGSGITISRDTKHDTITISSNIKEFDIDTIRAGDNIKIIKRADGGITINNTLQEFDIKSAVKAGNNITITDNPDGGIIINGQAGGVGGGDTEIGNFDVVAGWDTNINPSGTEAAMVEISGFGNVANW